MILKGSSAILKRSNSDVISKFRLQEKNIKTWKIAEYDVQACVMFLRSQIWITSNCSYYLFAYWNTY